MKSRIRILIDIALALCFLAVVLIILSGGYKGEILGLSVSASSPLGPVKLILVLLLLRAAATLKGTEFALLSVSIVLTLLLAELVLRIWDAPITRHQLVQIHRATPVSAWELIPGASGVGNTGALYEINQAGCRDHEYPSQKPPQTSRVVVLGDSFTFGMGVDLEHSYPKQLERVLRQRGLRVEVINCGVIAHSLWQHRATLESRARGLDPDLIILGLYQDDLRAISPPAVSRVPGYAGHNPFAKKGASRWRHRSRLYNLLRNMEDLLKYRFRSRMGASHVKSLEERRKIVGPENPEEINYRIMSGKLEPEKYREFKQALAEFAMAVDELGAQLLVILIPDSVQLNDPRMQVMNTVVVQASAEAGVPFLDLTPILEEQPDPQSLYLFPDDAHNNPKGLGIIAEGIADGLDLHGLFKKPGTSTGNGD